MFSSSVAGAGSICLGCQVRAVTRWAPVLAAASNSAAAAQSRIRRQERHASSGSSDAGASNDDFSNDDFFERLINEQRHKDPFDASKPKKRGKPYQVQSRTSKVVKEEKSARRTPNKSPSDGEPEEEKPFVRTFTDPSLREGAFTQPEVSFEDVFHQDTDLGNDGGNPNLASVVENPGEIDFGSSTYAEAPVLEQYSWNSQSAAELREQFWSHKRVKKARVPSETTEQSVEEDGLRRFSKFRSREQRREPAEEGNLGTSSSFRSREEKREPSEFRFKMTDSRPVRDYEWPEKNELRPVKDEARPEQPTAIPTDILFGGRGGPSSRSIFKANVRAQEPQDLFADWASPGMVEAPKREAPKRPSKTETRFYRKGTMKLMEDTADIPIETLGKDAPIIVLREAGEWKKSELPTDEKPTNHPLLKVEENIDQEDGLSMDVILDNIDELRPSNRILPARDFKKVYDILLKGFTALHLESYVEKDRARKAEGDERPFLGVTPEETRSRPWILSQSLWTPEVHGAVEDVDAPLKGYILKSMPPKHRLVMQLMRECWGMSVRELLDGQGVVDVEVRDQEFRLLTLGGQRFLSNISRTHLTQLGGKSIEVIMARKALRIVGPKTVAEACLQAMHEVLQKTKTKSVSLLSATKVRLTSGVLEELGRITNALVELDKPRDQLLVTWIDVQNRHDSKLEDLGDVVLRLLLAARPPYNTDTALEIHPDPSKSHGLTVPTLRLIEQVGQKEKLPWGNRRTAWARLCLPVMAKSQQAQLTKKWSLSESLLKFKIEPSADDYVERKSVIKTKTAAATAARYAHLAGVPLSFPRPRQYIEDELLEEINQLTKPTSSGWLPFRVHTTAVFGHVLHVNRENLLDSAKEKYQSITDLLASTPRALAPLIPPITEMHLPGWVPYKDPSNMTSLITMRFTPTITTPSASGGGPPTLELRLKASDEDVLLIDSLRAIAHTHVADICLPGEPVDVRATQRIVAELPGTVIEHTPGMQPLLQFLKDALLDPSRVRFVTPPVLDALELPEWLFYAPVTDLQSPFLRKPVLAALKDAAAAGPTAAAKPKSKSKTATKSKTQHNPSAASPHNPYALPANDLRPTSYLFAGLEVHHGVETAFDGWRLGYTSIEAGAGGGRRAELALDAHPAAAHELRRPQAAFNAGAWLQSVCRLATGRANKKDTPLGGDEEEVKIDESVVRWLGDKH